MSTLHLPWLELTILIPALGAVWIARERDPEWAQRKSMWCFAAVLACAVGTWIDFGALHSFEARDRWDLSSKFLGADALVVDELSAPLLPLAALIYLLTAVVTLRTKVRRFSFAATLASESILLATLSCKAPWGVVALLALGAAPPLLELRARGKPMRVFGGHMGLMVLLLVLGQTLVDVSEFGSTTALWGVLLLTAAALLRSGIVPIHCWMTDLFEHATFGTALLFVTPMAGAYAAIRLVLPIAPDWALQSIASISLFTAVYAAGMALVQREARRFFCYLFLSHSSLVLVGLETATPVGLTGALSLWLSIGLALTGFGLTLRSMEARTGRLAIDVYHGLSEHTPRLASFFLLTGLASVGFPGTFGFIGGELLLNGAVEAFPLTGYAVIAAAALNGIAVLLVYFRVFTGTRHVSSVDLTKRPREQFAVLTVALLIFGGGIFPQPGIASRRHAAMQLIESRRRLTVDDVPKSPTASTATTVVESSLAPVPHSIPQPPR